MNLDMRYSHDSHDEEGEIFETEVEKAPTSLPSVRGPSVDRQSSKTNRSSISPARSNASSRHSSSRRDDRHDRSYSSRYDSRDRRDYDDYRSRGEKRKRAEDYDDPRSFKVHYEGGGRDAHVHRPRVSYADIDRNDPRNDHRDDRLPYDDDHRRSRRSYTRSRSPAPARDRSRADYGRNGAGRRGGYDNRGRGGRDRYRERDDRDRRHEDTRRRSRDRSPRDQPPRAATPGHAKRDDKPFTNGNGKPADRGAGSRNGRFVDTGSKHVLFAAEVTVNSDNVPKKKENDVPVVIEDPVDEAKIIEERRKKREAIKAKYRGQATPLLVAALENKEAAKQESAASSPGRDPMDISTPRTPESPLRATPGGTFDISKDGTANGPDAAAAEEPSAADYDPMDDMKEDRDKREHRTHGNEVSSGTYNEMKSTDRDVLLPEAQQKNGPTPAAETENKADAGGDDDFDMFAEGDDDDMFAPEPSQPKESTVGKAVPIVQAQQLDVNMIDNWDDQEGYYKLIQGELMDNRYRVQSTLGKGMFSGVVRAIDQVDGKTVAIKLIRNNESMRKAGMKEIEILQKLREADPEDKKHIVRMLRYFDHKGHLCIVFENLNLNLREVLKKSGIRDVGISLPAVRAYAHQMFLGLALFRKCNIIHADLKPDNVLVSESQTMLKICDLGSASDAAENEITPYLVSRFYRAPEIILGIPYDFAIDMWSIGCTLYELYTGKILFTGRTNNQMLRNIMECRGKFPNKLLKKAQFAPLHFDDQGGFRSVEVDKITGKDVVRTINFQKPTRELKGRLVAAAGSGEDRSELMAFVDLLERCLAINPEKRCTPGEALRHPFILGTARAGGK